MNFHLFNEKPAVGKSYDATEFTQFISAFLKNHPEVVDDQRKGWNIYWDKAVDLDALEQAKEDHVPEKPYHYE